MTKKTTHWSNQGLCHLQWGQDTEHPNKLAHKNTDARWTKKGGQSHHGYKSHISIDKDTRLITKHACTDASVHDSQVLEAVLRDEGAAGKQLWADSACRSEEREQRLQVSGHISQIHERAYRGSPLTQVQEVSSKAKSRVRTRVEHVFGPETHGEQHGRHLLAQHWRRAGQGGCGADEFGLQPRLH
ncbi:MAG: transposase [Burkholderiales bacterium]